LELSNNNANHRKHRGWGTEIKKEIRKLLIALFQVPACFTVPFISAGLLKI